MTGALLQLQATGIQDAYLTAKPEIDIFKYTYFRHINFATETIRLNTATALTFGGKTYCNIPPKCHMLSKLYLYIKLPSLTKTSGTYASWTNGLGYAIFDYLEFEVNGVIVDKIYGTFQDIFHELTTPLNNKSDPMVLKSDLYTATQYNALQQNELMIPLDFWFNKLNGLGIPFMSLYNQNCKVNIKLKTFDECINYDGNTPPIKTELLESYMYGEYTIFDENLADKLAEAALNTKYIVEQVQFNEIDQLPPNTEKWQAHLRFNHPCKELLFVFKHSECVNNNDYFNYGNLHNNSILKSATFLINGLTRFDDLPESYYRLTFPNKVHSGATDKFIYCIPFALHPEKNQPTGSLNFSRLDNVSLHLNLNPISDTCQLHIYAVTYNVLSLKNKCLTFEFLV